MKNFRTDALCILLFIFAGCGGSNNPSTSEAQGINTAQHAWSIGIAQGAHPLELLERASPANPIFSWRDIKSPDTAFVADPFLIKDGKNWRLFFELFNLSNGRGEIGLASSRDLITWKFDGVVLAEQFHLSYPLVINHNGSYFMIPESRQANEIRIYRAIAFPNRWRFERSIIKGAYSDPSPVFFQNRWWLFACQSPYSLAIFYADDLLGPWKTHPLTPVYRNDASVSRPAGLPLVINNTLIRFVQDNRQGYGKRVRAMVVDKISPTEFFEHPAARDPFFGAHGAHWANNGMHHVGAAQMDGGTWVAAIDGNGDGR